MAERRHGLGVLVLLMFLMLGFLGLQQLGYSSMVGSNSVGMRSAATALIRERIAHVRSLGYDSADSTQGEEPYGAISGYPSHRRVTAVAPDAHVPEAKLVTVSVFWGGDRYWLKAEAILGPGQR
jgi:hypothetical protein